MSMSAIHRASRPIASSMLGRVRDRWGQMLASPSPAGSNVPRLEPGVKRLSEGAKVVVGMSGGVDSSVTALLLKAQGFDVHGLFMRNWDYSDELGDAFMCPADQDYADVKRVCNHLDIPCHNIDFVKEYWNEVFSPYLEGFGAGGTPNPDVFCNREIKFKAFRKHAMKQFNAEAVATGHYAQLQVAAAPMHPDVDTVSDPITRNVQLFRGIDPVKDQTYFLSAVPQSALQNSIFPLGGLLKTEVRELARLGELPTAEKAESMGICFVGKRDFGSFISQYLDDKPGDFVTPDGTVVGRHKGFHRYTIGQGARIGGTRVPLYVAAKNPKDRSIVVTTKTHPLKCRSKIWVHASEFYWVSGHPPCAPTNEEEMLHCMVANHGVVTQCKITNEMPQDTTGLAMDGANTTTNPSDWFCITLNERQQAVSPRQIAAIYDGNVCLGGGVIYSAA